MQAFMSTHSPIRTVGSVEFTTSYIVQICTCRTGKGISDFDLIIVIVIALGRNTYIQYNKSTTKHKIIRYIVTETIIKRIVSRVKQTNTREAKVYIIVKQ